MPAVPEEAVRGIHPDGLPVICQHQDVHRSVTEAVSGGGADMGTTPTRGWECVPGVIRDDGRESFRVEVRVDRPVLRVMLTTLSPRLISPAAVPFDLRDDGQAGDRIAGDLVFTSGPLTYNAAEPMPAHFWGDPTSPAGLDSVDVGSVTVTEADSSTSSFLLNPAVGILRGDIAAAAATALSADVVRTPHLLNVRSTSPLAQGLLRGLHTDLSPLTRPVYRVLPDAADFFVFFSTQKVEAFPAMDPVNFEAGKQLSVRVVNTGTGRGPYDNGAAYGSASRLLSVVTLDAGTRGIYSANVVHELLHQWVAYLDPALGLTDGTGHYLSRSNAGSLVGGQVWIKNANGTYTMVCSEGVNGAHAAAPLDLYMMGLVNGSTVPPLCVYSGSSPPPLGRCGAVINDVIRIVSMGEIQKVHGIRTPAPATAQRDYRICFVAESVNRLLTPTELTYYETLAAHFGAPVPAGEAAPYMGFNWASVQRFFGQGTTWNTRTPQFFDFDGDTDVDQSDFGRMQTCQTGPDAGPVLPGCDIADRDRDGDVDQDDTSVFEACQSGSGNPAGC